MDPNFIISGNDFDESKQWDLNGHYTNLLNDPLSDVGPLGFSHNSILNSEPFVSSSASVALFTLFIRYEKEASMV